MPPSTSLRLQLKMIKINYNPDVLSCLANLSSDEVFTPPNLANKILDLLPDDIWKDKATKFLDPCSKSGVFLREITKRLIKSLKDEIPDRQKRIEHILTRQVFGIAITELTAFLTRRSVYCSKFANGKYSVCENFTNEIGNIYFSRIHHTYVNKKCVFCGANQDLYQRGKELETYAYQFIHDSISEDLSKMKFDVIVGNPPYQLSDGGYRRSSSPIYNYFVHQAKKLKPKFLTMIIPSRWFAGGKGLTEFRKEILNDEQIKKIVDYEDSSQVFPGVDIAGGVCYFLWEKNFSGPCEIVNIKKDEKFISVRPLNEFKTLIRNGIAVSIIRKVKDKNETNMSTQVSSAKPFGLRTYVRPSKKGDIRLRWSGGEGFYERKKVSIGLDMIDNWKVIVSKVSYDHGGMPDKDGKRRVFSIIDILPPGTICTETYLVAGGFDNQGNAENLAKYLKTKFVRFLVSQLCFSHDIFKDKFEFVPILAMNIEWSDNILYKRYGLVEKEISFIETTIKTMA